MQGIAAIIEQVVMAAVLNHQPSQPRKSKADWAFMALSALLGVAGVGMLIVALERFFEKLYPLDLAALLTAGVILGVAAIISIGVCISRRRKPVVVPNTMHQELVGNLHAMLETLAAELEEPIRENPKVAVALAAVAGFVAAQRR